LHQCARRAVINRIARSATVSSATVRASGPSDNPSNVRHAATLAPAGAEQSIAIPAKICRGSIVDGSTRIAASAFREASDLVGRPPLGRGFPAPVAASFAIEVSSKLSLQHITLGLPPNRPQ
jgi:hypothetical protein